MIIDRPLCWARRDRCGRPARRSRRSWIRVVHIFWPLITYSSPSRTARVRSEARSVPAPGLGVADREVQLAGGDLRQVERVLLGRCRNRMIVGPTVLMVRNGTGAPATAASSVKISWSMRRAPRPPYSAGQPASASRRAHLPDDLLVGGAVAVLAAPLGPARRGAPASSARRSSCAARCAAGPAPACKQICHGVPSAV